MFAVLQPVLPTMLQSVDWKQVVATLSTLWQTFKYVYAEDTVLHMLRVRYTACAGVIHFASGAPRCEMVADASHYYWENVGREVLEPVVLVMMEKLGNKFQVCVSPRKELYHHQRHC